MRWGVPKQKRHCAAYGGISHQVIIVQKQKDFVIDVGQVTYQHRHDRMRMEQAVSPLARMWLGEAPIGLMLEVMRVPEVEVADLRSPFRRAPSHPRIMGLHWYPTFSGSPSFALMPQRP
jgi:hypothetical protein